MSSKKSTTKIKELRVEEVPEVQSFIAADAAVESFRTKHKKLFEEFTNLAEYRNSALEAADKILRSKEASCGPFRLINILEKYNAGKLLEEIGEKDFYRVGGVAKQVIEYSLDDSKFLPFVAADEFPEEVLEIVRTRIPRFKKIEKIVL